VWLQTSWRATRTAPAVGPKIAATKVWISRRELASKSNIEHDDIDAMGKGLCIYQ